MRRRVTFTNVCFGLKHVKIIFSCCSRTKWQLIQITRPFVILRETHRHHPKISSKLWLNRSVFILKVSLKRLQHSSAQWIITRAPQNEDGWEEHMCVASRGFGHPPIHPSVHLPPLLLKPDGFDQSKLKSIIFDLPKYFYITAVSSHPDQHKHFTRIHQCKIKWYPPPSFSLGWDFGSSRVISGQQNQPECI